ncbi:L,D-transpeptidase family protein [Ensifer soli]|uniref:L,D-transpeptidase family protein n=1 Tax=Ciceribacter sp. sgz301302 TaxID=3342379 RepID=UPI0035B8C5C2
MRIGHAVILASMAALLAGCTNETLDEFSKTNVDIKTVSNKTQHPLSPAIVAELRGRGIEQNSPIMIRILKEEGALEIWKADTSNRFQRIRHYKICAWSGKLGPKVKEGDRQAPEGFYPLRPQQMNPNSSYYLAINTGYPNMFDRANRRNGTNLMIHGACSSSGCYSMTDEQMLEIFAFARDAYKGGQQSIQLQALPFRMTAENMARHRDNPNFEFWKNLKEGYDQFELTKRPPEVNICEKKYVFNVEAKGTFNPSGQCPAMTTPPALQGALAAYQKTYDANFEKAVKKLDGLVWYEPSEADRKALMRDARKGRELAYAPTANALDAGKLMKVEDLEKRLAAQREAEEGRKSAAFQNAEIEKATRAGRPLPVPRDNPLPRPAVEEAAVEAKPKAGSFWSMFGAKTARQTPPEAASATADGIVAVAPPSAAAEGARTAPAGQAQARQGQTKPQQETSAAASAPVPAASPQAGVEATPAEPAKKKPFWKIWAD